MKKNHLFPFFSDFVNIYARQIIRFYEFGFWVENHNPIRFQIHLTELIVSEKKKNDKKWI